MNRHGPFSVGRNVNVWRDLSRSPVRVVALVALMALAAVAAVVVAFVTLDQTTAG